MRVTVDMAACMSNGQCVAAAPEVFALDDDGELTVLNELPPEELAERVRLAVALCPTQAIRLEEQLLR